MLTVCLAYRSRVICWGTATPSSSAASAGRWWRVRGPSCFTRDITPAKNLSSKGTSALIQEFTGQTLRRVLVARQLSQPLSRYIRFSCCNRSVLYKDASYIHLHLFLQPKIEELRITAICLPACNCCLEIAAMHLQACICSLRSVPSLKVKGVSLLVNLFIHFISYLPFHESSCCLAWNIQHVARLLHNYFSGVRCAPTLSHPTVPSHSTRRECMAFSGPTWNLPRKESGSEKWSPF